MEPAFGFGAGGGGGVPLLSVSYLSNIDFEMGTRSPNMAEEPPRSAAPVSRGIDPPRRANR